MVRARVSDLRKGCPELTLDKDYPSTDMPHVVEQFAGWAEAYRATPIAPQVLHHARRAVIVGYEISTRIGAAMGRTPSPP